MIHEHARNWPTLPLPEVVHKCLKAYYTNTSQKRPRCCAVCACRRWNTQMHEYVISNDSSADLQGLHILHITDKYIIECLTLNSIIPHFGNLAMDEYPLLLHSPGVHIKDKTLGAHIDVCNHCHASLKVHKVPKFSLKTISIMATFLMSSMTLLGLKKWQWQYIEPQHMLLGYTS